MSVKQRAFLILNDLEVFYGGSAGGGKLQPLDSRILTSKGWRAMGDIHPGDTVTDPVTGGTSVVLQEFPHGEMDIYEIECDDGAVTRAGGEHLWNWRASAHKLQRPRRKRSDQREFCKENLGTSYPQDRWDSWKVGTTLDMLDSLEKGNGVRIPLTEPVLFDVNGRTGTGILDAYLLGLMMGDGSYRHKNLTTADEEIRVYVRSRGFKSGNDGRSAPDGGGLTWIMTDPIRRAFAQWLTNNGLRGKRSWEKYIPDYVFTAGVQYRLEFLQGLMDTDGTVDERGRCYFSSTSIRLAEGVQALVRSLGGKAALRERQTQYTSDNTLKDGRPSFNVRCWLPKTSALFRLSRKKDRCTDSWNGGYELTREVVRITKVGREPAKCIRVSSPHGLYITDDYIVTHNSVGLLMAALQYVDVPHYHALLVRRTFADLFQPDAIGDLARQWLSSTDAKWNERRYEWSFPSSAKLKFGYLDGPTDHYQFKCCAEGTETLTPNGWKLLEDIQPGESVFSLDPVTRSVSFQRVSCTYGYVYTGSMVTTPPGSHVDFCVTPNHVIWHSSKKCDDLKPSLACRIRQNGARLPTSGIWDGIEPVRQMRFCAGSRGKDIQFSPMDWAEFLGWYISEGNLSTDGDGYYRVTITQTGRYPENRKRIIDVLKRSGANVFVDEKRISACNKELWTYLQEYCGRGSKFKTIPRVVFKYNTAFALRLLYALIGGDGTWTRDDETAVYLTTSRQLADDVMELGTRCGFRSSLVVGEYNDDYHFLSEGVFYRVNLSQRMLKDTLFHPETIEYSGRVHSLEVPPYHTYMIRYNGKVSFTGNSSQFQFIGFDEASELRSNQMTYLFMTRMRKAKALGAVPLRARFASNPGGPSHEWLYDRYVNPDTRHKGTIFIPASLDDNQNIDPEYEQTLELLKNEDPTEYARLRHGNWQAVEPGTFFKAEWFMGRNVVHSAPVHANRVRYWDLASIDPSLAKKRSKEPDWTVGAKLSLAEDGLCYVEDIIRVQKTPGTVEDIIRTTAEEDGIDVKVYIEQEPGASGVAQIEHYSKVLAGFRFEGHKATGRKESYADTFASYAEAGNVRLLFAPWNRGFRNEAESFPAPPGMHDDQIDAASKAFHFLTKKRLKARAWGRR